MTPVEPARPEPIGALDEQQTASLLESTPPMRGAEYLSAQTLQCFWLWFDDWVCRQIRQHGSLGAFLEQHAPRWHQAGRVCFHLAENKLDPDYPFAFMATYAPEFTGQSQGADPPPTPGQGLAGIRGRPQQTGPDPSALPGAARIRVQCADQRPGRER